MKFFFISILFSILLINTLFGQKNIKKIEVNEVGYNVTLSFKSLNDEIDFNKLKIKITPISTPSLNQKFIEENSFNGMFEYSYFEKSRNSFFLTKRKKNQEKSDLEFLIEGIEWLLENEKINSVEFEKLKNQIHLSFETLPTKEFGERINLNSSNPYFIKDKYLNIFEIEFNNTSDSYQKFNKTINLETGDLLLMPLKTNEIVDQLNDNNQFSLEKLNTLIKYNLTDMINVPPHSKFKKYFAIPPINFKNKDIKISIEDIPEKFIWSVEKSFNSLDSKYTFFEFNTNWVYEDLSSEAGLNFTSFNSIPNIIFSNNLLFIEESEINKEFELVSISLFADKIFFGRSKLKGSDFLELEKNKRKQIYIKTTKIDELKKKIK